jgi:hypothetical protein
VPSNISCKNYPWLELSVGDKILNIYSLNFKRGEILQVGIARGTGVLPIQFAFHKKNFTITKIICQGKINRYFKQIHRQMTGSSDTAVPQQKQVVRRQLNISMVGARRASPNRGTARRAPTSGL